MNALIHLVTECALKSPQIMEELLLDDKENLQEARNNNLGEGFEEEEHKMNEE
jgi:hypothetical protein